MAFFMNLLTGLTLTHSTHASQSPMNHKSLNLALRLSEVLLS